MIVVTSALTECRSCYSRELRPVLKLESIPLGDKFSKIQNREERHPVRLVNCDSCGLVQFDGLMNSAAIFESPKVSEVESIIEEDCATDFGYTQQLLSTRAQLGETNTFRYVKSAREPNNSPWIVGLVYRKNLDVAPWML